MAGPSGIVKNLEIPWLFQDIKNDKKTGTVVLEKDGATKKIYFNNGDIIFASSSLNTDRLAEFLVRTGKITAEQRDTLTETVRTSGKQEGAVLIERGIVRPADLVDQVNQQVKQIILDLFSWRNGTYQFSEGPLPQADIIPLSMTTANMILEGIGALDWQVIRKALPPPETVLRPAAVPSRLFRIADLTPEQKNIYAMINGSRTIEELCSLSVVGDFNTYLAIYALLAIRMVEPGTATVEEARMSTRDTARAASGNNGGCEDAGNAAPVSRDAIQEAHAALDKQDHYQILGVDKTITPAELKKVYFRLAKRFHPDRHNEAEMADMKTVIQTLFTRINQAYETLSNDLKRNEYDRIQVQGSQKAPQAVKARNEKLEKRAAAAKQFETGMAAFKIGNFWGAEESFRWACQFDPENGKYFHYRGIALSRIPRRSHDAEEELRKAIELDPEISGYHLELGNLYLKGGLKSRALQYFTHALELDPASDAARKAVEAAGGTAAPQEEPKGQGRVFNKMFKDGKKP
jgi:curved DNA-binding protein CbpA